MMEKKKLYYKEIDISEIVVQKFDIAILYKKDDIELLKDCNLKSLDYSDLLEARFIFGENEVHIFECDDEQKTVLISEDIISDKFFEYEDIIKEKYEIENKYKKKFGDENTDISDEIVVKKYVNYDEDGQIYVVYIKLAEI